RDAAPHAAAPSSSPDLRVGPLRGGHRRQVLHLHRGRRSEVRSGSHPLAPRGHEPEPRRAGRGGRSVTRRISTLALLALGGLAGCVGDTTEEPPIVPIQNMYNQPRYDSQSKAPFFADGRTMRPQVAGTVAYEADAELSHATGRTEDNAGW